MKKLSALIFLFCLLNALAVEKEFLSPDKKTKVIISDDGNQSYYKVEHDGEIFIMESPIGLITDLGNFSNGLKISDFGEPVAVKGTYNMKNTKKSDINFEANEASVTFAKDSIDVFRMHWHLQNNNVAFRYELLPKGDTIITKVIDETTLFNLPAGTTTFLSSQMSVDGSWKRAAPSYETYYYADENPDKGLEAENGFIFPSLFKIGDNGWLQISETGVGSNYAGSHLKYVGDNGYKLALPNEKEFNGNGTVAPGLALPGFTPWRTLTLGETLAPIVETTIQFDLVEPLYEPSQDFTFGKGTWSWIIYDDQGTVYPVQEEYIDFSNSLGFQSVLIDAFWDQQIGREGIETLAKKASDKNIGLFLWYNSNGYWNDTPHTPKGIMDNTISRRKEMKWMKDNNVRGIKVDFIGSDKQMAMKLYEDILSDANDFGLMVIFHGCTLPRGWEKMYPNFVAAEAVRASENLRFTQEECDREAFNATFHPVSRNSMASMDFGGSTLNRFYNAQNKPGASERKTSDIFALATAVLFQSPVQHFALSPEGVKNLPKWILEFFTEIPTTWNDIKWIAGYPGKNVAIARRHNNKWYVSAINAAQEDFSFSIPQELLENASAVRIYQDSQNLTGSMREVNPSELPSPIVPLNGGYVAIIE